MTTTDGRSFTDTVYAPRGSAINGIDWADVEKKFRILCPFAGTSVANIERCGQVIRNFREVRNVRELVELMA